MNPFPSGQIVGAVLLAFCVCFLVISQKKLPESPFLIRPPQIDLSASAAVDGARFGPVRVVRGTHYLFQIDGLGGGRFDLRLTYSDGAQSRPLLLDRRGGAAGLQFRAVLAADRSDPAAMLTFKADQRAPDARFTRLQIFGLKAIYYTWRTVIKVFQVIAAIVLLAAICRWAVRAAGPDFWRREKPTDAPPEVFQAPAGKAIRIWTVALVLAAAAFAATFVEHRFGQLYQHPYYPAVSGADDSYYFLWLHSVMVDGDVDFSNDLLYCDSMPMAMRKDIVENSERTKLGLLPNKYPIGWALMETPWYGAASVTAHAANLFGARIPYDGWRPLYQTWLVIGQLVYACAGLYFAYRIVSWYVPEQYALCGVTLSWLASSLFYYQVDQVSMAHNVMFFSATGAYFFTLRLRETPRRYGYWLLTGVFCALVILSRYQGGVLLLFPAVICLQMWLRDRWLFRHALLAMAAGAILLSLQLIAWRLVYGSFVVYSYTGERFNWLQPQWYSLLFSPLHGLFNWHPAMMIGFAGFALWLWRTRWRTDAACFACSLVLVTYVNASWSNWWFGCAFGSRAFEVCTLFAMIGVSLLLSLAARRRFLFHIVAAMLFLLGIWNMNLAWMVERGRLPLETPITWAERLNIIKSYWRFR